MVAYGLWLHMMKGVEFRVLTPHEEFADRSISQMIIELSGLGRRNSQVHETQDIALFLDELITRRLVQSGYNFSDLPPSSRFHPGGEIAQAIMLTNNVLGIPHLFDWKGPMGDYLNVMRHTTRAIPKRFWQVRYLNSIMEEKHVATALKERQKIITKRRIPGSVQSYAAKIEVDLELLANSSTHGSSFAPDLLFVKHGKKANRVAEKIGYYIASLMPWVKNCQHDVLDAAKVIGFYAESFPVADGILPFKNFFDGVQTAPLARKMMGDKSLSSITHAFDPSDGKAVLKKYLSLERHIRNSDTSLPEVQAKKIQSMRSAVKRVVDHRLRSLSQVEKERFLSQNYLSLGNVEDFRGLKLIYTAPDVPLFNLYSCLRKQRQYIKGSGESQRIGGGEAVNSYHLKFDSPTFGAHQPIEVQLLNVVAAIHDLYGPKSYLRYHSFKTAKNSTNPLGKYAHFDKGQRSAQQSVESRLFAFNNPIQKAFDELYAIFVSDKKWGFEGRVAEYLSELPVKSERVASTIRRNLSR